MKVTIVDDDKQVCCDGHLLNGIKAEVVSVWLY